MSLFLSRLQLNGLSRRAMAFVADPTFLHHSLYDLFKRESSGRILFRVDSNDAGPTVLIQSAIPPNWSELELNHADLLSVPASKEVEIAPNNGSALGFRLMARPMRVESTGKGNPRGPRRDLRKDDERLDWLHRKGESNGFRVRSCSLTIFSFGSIKSSVGFQAPGGSFTAVRFDGELVVTDAVKLREAVASGIGTQKAYGFGLLSLAPTR